MDVVRVQTEDFDVGAELHALTAADPGVGAVASFLGLVRDGHGGQSVSAMTLEHYPGMTERQLQRIVGAAHVRWPLSGVRVVHRVGPLLPGDRIVLVAVASAHRQAAFLACEFIMDYLKSEAPFWKKETTPDGERWVDARDSDVQALARWQS